jgi:hypothetical protein
MRRLALLLPALLIFAPTPWVSPGDGGAWAAGSKVSAKKKASPPSSARKKRPVRPAAKKPAEIKLKGAPAADEPAQAQGGVPQRGPTRIDFDDRLIQGQSNKSGAVYLYDRKELKTGSMVRTRESFRTEIVKTVYDE